MLLQDLVKDVMLYVKLVQDQTQINVYLAALEDTLMLLQRNVLFHVLQVIMKINYQELAKNVMLIVILALDHLIKNVDLVQEISSQKDLFALLLALQENMLQNQLILAKYVMLLAQLVLDLQKKNANLANLEDIQKELLASVNAVMVYLKIKQLGDVTNVIKAV